MKSIYGIFPGVLIAFGMGGGSLLIYLLNKFEQYMQQEVQYINLWLFVFAASYTVFSYNKKKKISYNLIKIMLPFSVVACIVASIISKQLDTATLKKYFGFFLMVIGIWQVFQIIYVNIKKKKENNTNVYEEE